MLGIQPLLKTNLEFNTVTQVDPKDTPSTRIPDKKVSKKSNVCISGVWYSDGYCSQLCKVNKMMEKIGIQMNPDFGCTVYFQLPDVPRNKMVKSCLIAK